MGVRLENGRYEDVVLAVDPAMGTDVISITNLEKKVKVRNGTDWGSTSRPD